VDVRGDGAFAARINQTTISSPLRVTSPDFAPRRNLVEFGFSN
jgi:hypothetical protein